MGEVDGSEYIHIGIENFDPDPEKSLPFEQRPLLFKEDKQVIIDLRERLIDQFNKSKGKKRETLSCEIDILKYMLKQFECR